MTTWAEIARETWKDIGERILQIASLVFFAVVLFVFAKACMSEIDEHQKCAESGGKIHRDLGCIDPNSIKRLR